MARNLQFFVQNTVRVRDHLAFSNGKKRMLGVIPRYFASDASSTSGPGKNTEPTSLSVEG